MILTNDILGTFFSFIYPTHKFEWFYFYFYFPLHMDSFLKKICKPNNKKTLA